MRSSHSSGGGGPEQPPATTQPPTDPAEALATLVTMIETARRLAVDVAGDGLSIRLQRTFAQMPPEDREIVLQVLEREVEYRLLTRGTGDLVTGYATRPNPNARFYLRVLTTPEAPPLLDHEELVVANQRWLRVLRFARGLLRDVWTGAMAEAAAALDPAERATARQVLLDTIAHLDAADQPPHDPGIAAKKVPPHDS